MAQVSIQSVVVNDKGRVRGNNEDNFLLNGIYLPREMMDEGADKSLNCQSGVQIYAICDGMGGADAGEEASFQAVKLLAGKKMEYRSMMSSDIMNEVLRDISDKINRQAVQKGLRTGTTIALALVDGPYVHVTNVGDSRVYRMRDGHLEQLSLDHSRVQRMINMGIITPEQAKTDPGRHIISQYLGMPPEIRISPYNVEKMELQKGDIFLLCSDGLTDMVTDDAIERIINTTSDLKMAADELLQTALQNGGRDNTTVMMFQIMDVESVTDREKRDNRKKWALNIGRIVTAAAMVLTTVDFIYYLAS